MSKFDKKYEVILSESEVILSDGLIYNAVSLSEAKRVYEFLRVAFPSYTVKLNICLM